MGYKVYDMVTEGYTRATTILEDHITNYNAELQLNGSYLHEDGDVYWYNELGEIHNADGPAIIRNNGEATWHLNDKRYTFNEWCIGALISEETRMLLRLQYG